MASSLVSFNYDFDKERRNHETPNRKPIYLRRNFLALLALALLIGLIPGCSLSLLCSQENITAPEQSNSYLVPSISVLKFPNSDNETYQKNVASQREMIRLMAREAWQAYRTYAWGDNAIFPILKHGTNSTKELPAGPHLLGATIVASLSTLWLMNLTEEYEQGRAWVKENLIFSTMTSPVSVNNLEEHLLASLLSCYALTNDKMYLDKAVEVGRSIYLAHSHSTGLPYKFLTPSSGSFSESTVELSYLNYPMGMRYLADLLAANNSISGKLYLQILNKGQESLEKAASTSNNLYLNQINSLTGKWISPATKQTLYTGFQSGLINAFLQTGNKKLLKMYRQAIDAISKPENRLLVYSPTGLLYARQFNSRSEEFSFCSSCSLGGSFALGAWIAENEFKSVSANLSLQQQRRWLRDIGQQWHQAEAITEACHAAANSTRSGIMAERTVFGAQGPKPGSKKSGTYWSFIPESYLQLWRLTHEERYREWVWEYATAIRRFRLPDGVYSQLDNVDDPNSENHIQDSGFIGRTLTLYLIFSDDSVLPNDQWVFNWMGQPLPICGKHPAYPKCNH